jgi:hypothetical protein
MQLHSLRYARNSELLAKYFDDVVSTLGLIQQEYRDHGNIFVKRADRYPPEVRTLNKKYSERICKHFGVVHPDKVATAKAKFLANGGAANAEATESEGLPCDQVNDGPQEDDSTENRATESGGEDGEDGETGAGGGGDEEVGEEAGEEDGKDAVDKDAVADVDADEDARESEAGEEEENSAAGDEGGAGDLGEDNDPDDDAVAVVVAAESTDTDGGRNEHAITDAASALTFQRGSWEEYQTLPQLPLLKKEEDATANEIKEQPSTLSASSAVGAGGRAESEDNVLVLAVVRDDAPVLARTLIGEPVCEEASQLVEPSPPASETDEFENENKDGEVTTAENDETTDAADAAAPASTASTKTEKTWAARLPYDIQGQNCVDPIVFTVVDVAKFVTGLRNTFLVRMAEDWSQREVRVVKVAKRHRRKSLAELEERLRLHWPRKGNADVMYMQPRIGEISMHRKRLERQKRSVLQRHRTMGERFDKIVSNSREQIAQFLTIVDTLTDMLRTQSSLAGLQGVMKRCKDSVTEFDELCAARGEEMAPLIDVDPRSLVDSNTRFIATCLTHEEDGDYELEEVDICKAALNKVNKYCAKDVASRTDTIAAVGREQHAARCHFQNFADVYALTVKDLSMREGVGKKYGQPRRKFLESIRTVSTFSERVRKKLDQAISRIVEVCGMEAGEVVGKPGMANAPQLDTITRDLMHTALFVRMEFRVRLSYLEAQAEKSTVASGAVSGEEEEAALRVSLSTDPDDRMSLTEDNDESIELFGGQLFSHQIKLFKAECCEGTKKIYEDEGKLDEVGEDGVPEKLRTYLDRKEAEALQYGLETAKEFRAQVDSYQQRLAELPKALYKDVAARARHVIKSHIGSIERAFILTSDESDARKNIHKMELRPDLGSPNHVEDLENLCVAEKARSRKLCKDILEAERAVLAVIEKSSHEYVAEIVELTTSLMALADSTVAPWDIKDTRSPEEIEESAAAKQRPSLKTLRRIRAKEQSGKTVPAGTILIKEWPALPRGELETKTYVIPKQPEEEEERKPNVASPEGEGNGDGSFSETPEVQTGEGGASAGEEEAIEITPLMGKVTTATRSLMRWRDRFYTEFKSEFHEMCRTYKMRFSTLLQAERTWIQNWNTMTDVLRAKAQEGGIL